MGLIDPRGWLVIGILILQKGKTNSVEIEEEDASKLFKDFSPKLYAFMSWIIKYVLKFEI